MWWYDYQDDGWNPEYNENNFGIMRPDLTPKPAYYVMADVSDLIRHGEYVDRLDTSDENLWVLQFRHGQEDIWAVWSGDDQDHQVILETKTPGQNIVIQKLGHGPIERHWGYRDWAEDRSNEFDPQQLAVVVGHRPYLIKGNLSGVSVVDVVSRASDQE
jgi:hypothetical protein